METSLIPDLQLIAQLEKEIEREKNFLDQDEIQLNTLTKNAARDESMRKAQMKKVWSSGMSLTKIHPLLRESGSGDPPVAINLISEPMVPVYDVGADKAMGGVLKDLSSHLSSLSSNLNEMKEVRAWLNRAEESLGEVLRRLEGSEDVDRVYGEEVV
jgi:DNA repair ATPase RecN